MALAEGFLLTSRLLVIFHFACFSYSQETDLYKVCPWIEICIFTLGQLSCQWCHVRTFTTPKAYGSGSSITFMQCLEKYTDFGQNSNVYQFKEKFCSFFQILKMYLVFLNHPRHCNPIHVPCMSIIPTHTKKG